MIGTTLGPYRVLAKLGEGGMGEVYRARDTKLNRDVAIKILPPEFANDPDRLARFKREAQVLASLNHPNVGGIYGFEESGGVQALILELVEGSTLAEMLASGSRLRASAGVQPDSGPGLKPEARGLKPSNSLPVDEALAIARQIADALEAAHEQGIIHRDLKPANIKIRQDGMVKVLDFGLARLADPAVATVQVGSTLTQSPTITTPAMTQAGMILGTAAYMSPEQAKGRSADRRSDIWAFGCVLYEMLTGERAFDGDDVAETLANILKSDPDWSLLPHATPTSVQRLLHRCLVKDSKRRIGDATVLRIEIDDASEGPAAVKRSGLSANPWPSVAAGFLIGGVLVGVAILLFTRGVRSDPEHETHVDVVTRETQEPTSLALSPDGRHLAYAADNDSRSQIWIRDLSTGSTRVLDGTVNGFMPFWSPDSRSLGFFANGRLLTIDVDAGTARDIASAPGGRGGGAWTSEGAIVFAPAGVGPIVRVAANGGPTMALTHMSAGQIGHRAPYLLPDGRHFVFYAAGPPDSRGVYLGSVDGTPERRLFDADANGPYIHGHLLFVRGGVLFAQPFDPKRLEVGGDPFRVAPAVVSQPNGVAALSAVSDEMAFRGGIAGDRRQLTWFDRSGKRLEALGDVDVRTDMRGVVLAPDGQRVATSRTINGFSDIYTFELARAIWSRITTNPATDSQPVWSPDGARLAFVSSRSGTPDLYLRDANAGGNEELLFASEALKGPTDWSPDGQTVLFDSTIVTETPDLYAVDIRTHDVTPVVRTDAAELNGQISPDGKWIAYESNQSGSFEVYVQPFLAPGPRVQISTAGGAQARWRADGRDLFYVDLTQRLTEVPIIVSADGRTIEPGRPVPLFQLRMPGGVIQQGGNHQQYAVSRDGQRFLVNTLLSNPDDPPITLILNWSPDSRSASR